MFGKRQFPRFVAAAIAVAAVLLVVAAVPALAADTDWPTKPVQLIVTASPGGGSDLSARIIAKYLGDELGQPVMVTNIRGGGGSIGAKKAMESPPDGYTMLWAPEGLIINNVLGIADFGYRDFEIGAKVYDVELVAVVANRKFKTLEDVRKAALEQPGEVTFAIEIATLAHLIPLTMEKDLGIELNLVESGSLNDRLPQLLSEQLDMTFGPVGIFKDYIESGDINVLGLILRNRSQAAPELPTFIEQGVNIATNKYFIIYFPKGTPAAIIEKLGDAVERAVRNPGFIEAAKNIMFEPGFARPADTLPYLENTEKIMTRYRDVLMQK